MKTPLQVIESYGAPINSFIKTVLFFREQLEQFPQEEYENNIKEIVGSEEAPKFSSTKEAELFFLYTVQETVRAFSKAEIPDMSEVWNDAKHRAETFITEHPWAVKEYDTDNNETEYDDDGNVIQKIKKGAKKERAETLYKNMNDGSNRKKDIIDALMTELDMSKSGATTYFYNLKKQFGFSGPKPVKKPKVKKETSPQISPKPKKIKGPSKGSMAREIYLKLKDQPKEIIVEEIIKQTGTSPAGANTYYCAAKKEFK